MKHSKNRPVKDILIIDDEDVILQAVKRVAEGYSIDEATDAESALQLVESTSYRLILCDIMMPRMDGFAFLDEFRRRHITIPVIMTTGYSTVENAVQSLTRGAIDFLAKPFTTDELLAVIARGLRCSAMQHKLLTSMANELIYVACPPKFFRLGIGSWVSMEADGTALVGATDYFMKTIDVVTQICLSPESEELHQGNPCAYLESEDHLIHSVLCPLSGKILRSNINLKTEISLIEKDPFFKGWFYRIIPSHVDYEMPNLISCSSDRV